MLDQVMLDPSLTIEQKGLYALISVLEKGERAPNITVLARHSGFTRKTLRLLLSQMETSGLVSVVQSEHDRRVHLVTLIGSVEERSQVMIQGILRRINQARKRVQEEGSKESIGEALMKEWLSLLIADDLFSDNARPGFLTSPLTGERLEYDRWYPRLRLAWEFHGPHHFQAVKQQADPAQLARQQNNDMVKIGLSQREGIILTEVQAKDLRLHRMIDLIPVGVPMRSLDGLGPVVTFLEQESARYRFHVGMRD